MKKTAKLDRAWEIWLVHHTHVDIGYTDPQPIIMRKHAEFVAQALDFCNATDNLPAGERFTWTCEVAWTVKAFLARYPERAEEFFRRVREGRIEVTALYLQLTDLFTAELLEETTDYALALGKTHAFEVATAMNDDVNGWAWGLPDLLSRRGVRFMDTAINETRALGVRPRPAMFRWTGPGGGNVLFWHGNSYLYGNGLGFERQGGLERVIEYLHSLETSGYPHDVIEVRIHGEQHDNAPPGLWICDMVRRWNSRPASPRLRLVTPRAWFEEAAARWPVPFTDQRAGWPDWWADGNGSAAAESALVRRAQAELKTANALAVATGQTAPPDRLERARDAAAFFCEHTWGAWCSTDDPGSVNSKSQWNAKAGFAYDAAVEADSLVRDMLASEASKRSDGQPGILVFNPSEEPRTDLVEIVVPDADLGLPCPPWISGPKRSEAGAAFYLQDRETGAKVPVHRIPAIADSARRPAQIARFIAGDVPAHGFRCYRVTKGSFEPKSVSRARSGVLSGTLLKAEIAENGAGLAAVRRKDGGVNWVDAKKFSLAEVVYETIGGPRGREKLCGWGGIRKACPIKRARLRFLEPKYFRLPYGAGVRLRGWKLPGSLRELTLEAIVYDELPRLDLHYRIDKSPENEAEALYVAFPLAAGEGREVWLDVPGAVMRPGRDQVPGTATDWHSLQHYFAVSDRDRTIVVAAPDIPLVQVNGINTGLWQATLPSPTGLVMSWVFNNYWFTNFPAAQGGSLDFRYSLAELPGSFDAHSAARFAASVRHPFIAAVIPSAK